MLLELLYKLVRSANPGEASTEHTHSRKHEQLRACAHTMLEW